MCYLEEEVEDVNFSELAELGGFVPLAACIVGKILSEVDGSLELMQRLREKPIAVLRNVDQCLLQVIESFFQKLSEEDQEALVWGLKGISRQRLQKR